MQIVILTTVDDFSVYINIYCLSFIRHIDFITLDGMAQVVEGNHGNDSKRRVASILCLSKFDYSLHFYFYEHTTKQMCACVIL